MTFDEFLTELEKTKGWKLTPLGLIRTSRRYLIAGWNAGKPNSKRCCPIERVAVTTKKIRSTNPEFYWGSAADTLGLSRAVAERIMRAADNEGAPQARRLLLKACRLPPDPE